MDGVRKGVEPEQVSSLVRAAFGPTRHLHTVTRLRGGSKKGVYRLHFRHESSAILYVWDATENYWPPAPDGAASDRTDPFAEASGLALFEASHTRLEAIGVRTPQVYFLDSSRSCFPAECAVVEDVRGGTLEARVQDDPSGAEPTLVRLGAALQTMHQQQGRSIGKVALVGSGEARQDRSCEQIVVDRAVHQLAEAAARDERLAVARERLEQRLRGLAALVRPRVPSSGQCERLSGRPEPDASGSCPRLGNLPHRPRFDIDSR